MFFFFFFSALQLILFRQTQIIESHPSPFVRWIPHFPHSMISLSFTLHHRVASLSLVLGTLAIPAAY